MLPLNKLYRRFHHVPLQPPIASQLDTEDGDHLVFDSDLNAFDSVQPETEVLEYIDFDTAYSNGHLPGRLHWEPDAGTLEIDLPGGDVKLQVGQEVLALVINDSGALIPNGTPVYVDGALNGIPLVKVASKDDYAKAFVLGITTEDIAPGETGYVTELGLVRELNTAAFGVGDILWLGDAGAILNVRPTPGPTVQLLVFLGECVVSDATEGVIFSKPIIVPRLQGLTDVLDVGLSDGDVPIWVAADSRFEFFNPSSAASKEVPWSFLSPSGTTGTFYWGGFYEFGLTNDDFSPAAVPFGSANHAVSAHFFIVLGEAATDEITIRVTGTSTNDAGVTTPADTQDIVIPNGTPIDTYFETSKKWVGTVSVQTVGGTAKNCNYGFSKYWDNSNTDFTVTGFEVTWLGGANDANPNIQLIHHKTTGWTYNAGAAPTPPTPIADMAVTLGAGKAVVNGKNGAFKRTGISVDVDGSASEGTIWAVTNSANSTFDLGNILMSVTPRF